MGIETDQGDIVKIIVGRFGRWIFSLVVYVGGTAHLEKSRVRLQYISLLVSLWFGQVVTTEACIDGTATQGNFWLDWNVVDQYLLLLCSLGTRTTYMWCVRIQAVLRWPSTRK